MKKTDDEVISLKLLDLFTSYSIKDSEITLNFLKSQVKFYENERDYLLENKPYNSQKKKMKVYNTKLEKVEQKILKLYEDIGEEIQIIAKLQKTIDKEEKIKIDKKKKIA